MLGGAAALLALLYSKKLIGGSREMLWQGSDLNWSRIGSRHRNKSTPCCGLLRRKWLIERRLCECLGLVHLVIGSHRDHGLVRVYHLRVSCCHGCLTHESLLMRME